MTQRLDVQLKDIEDKKVIGDDYVPSLILDDSPYTLPSLFGCRTFLLNGLLLANSSNMTLDELLEIDPEDIVEKSSPAADDVFATAQYFASQTNGELPIHYGDPQGPFSVAASVMGSGIYTSMYDRPDDVKRFLEIITEVVILFYKRQREAMRPAEAIPVHLMPYIWRPPGTGFALSEDNLAVISPTAFREFVLPCLKRARDAFGGDMILHSCGDCTHQFQEIADTDWIAGYHLSQTPISAMSDVLARNGKLILSYNGWANQDAFLSYAAEMRAKGVPHLMQVCAVGNELPTLQIELDRSRSFLAALRKEEERSAGV